MNTHLPDIPDTVNALKILLVEDDDVISEMTSEMLERLGFIVEHARNGRQALELYDNSQHVLILMDCMMPVMNGYDACRELRRLERDNRQANVPVIAITAYSKAEINDKCIASGMNDILSKPFSMPDLHSILIKWLGMHSADNGGEITLTDYTPVTNITPDNNADELTVIDRSALEKLRMRHNQRKSGLLVRVINAYLAQSSTLLEELSDFTESADINGIARITHTLKSSSINVGAFKLSELCRQVEQQSSQGMINTTLINRIHTDFSNVKEELEKILVNASQDNDI